ncbi:hypothetical protein WICMUC_005937 [Wickerhamomyces mucosus]|uniref:NADP-dependent oxidoreductase domain-containing protein n=1 Tax=Wickerhamomyces mucosus TaxID=1378264 RepID=A0A9P8T252_9ASCO|nr:hypothetical protein WICMUC_005937 [Wickerhamomyces mucosus]
MSSINLQSASSKGFGTMNFTWRADPIPKETAFDALKTAIETNLPKKTFINGGEFYGEGNINLIYLKEFFEKYPELRKHSIISIKGGIGEKGPSINLLESSVDNIISYLPDLDIFEPARLDPSSSIEDQVARLDQIVDSGKIKGFTLSEVSGKTLSNAVKVAEHNIEGVEVEFSLFSRDIITNGLVKSAGGHDIPIIAYSPLSRGVLTGTLKSVKDIPKGDIRLHFERFSEENFENNLKLVEVVEQLASKKQVTAAQLSLAWLHYHSEKTINGLKFPKIIPIPSSSSVGRVNENFADVVLTEQEFNTINKEIEKFKVHGGRYNKGHEKLLDQ